MTSMNDWALSAKWLTEKGKGFASKRIRVFDASFVEQGTDRMVMTEADGVKYLLVSGGGPLYAALGGEERLDSETPYKICPLTRGNRLVLNEHLPYTKPRAFGSQMATIGLGDRLGLASPGHIKTVAGRAIRPILAQQSIRELTLTERTYEDVLDAASYAVFQEGYQDGWGADGDHLKTKSDIEMALRLGFSMLTLDASEHIDNEAATASDAEVAGRYELLDRRLRSRLEADYENRSFSIEGGAIAVSGSELRRYALVYSRAIQFMVEIYRTYIDNADREIDFEISIDETSTPTDPAAHWFVASELYREGVRVYSMAPRFCGEFQKGIDYIGDLAQFERELSAHARIADHFGYKLSIHSGSDKFSVFPLVAKYTKGRFHLKTAGTNWLEAVRTVARVNPSLYRRMHEFASERVSEALKYYHITADFSRIKPLHEVADADLPEYMNDNNARQLIHITYGLILTARDEEGKRLFKDEFYYTLNNHRQEYEDALIAHIGKHLTLLAK